TLPVRVRLNPHTTVGHLLAQLQDQQSGLMAHHHLTLTDIQRLAGGGELFDTLAVLENYPLDADVLELPGTGLRVTDVEPRDATHYPLSLAVIPGDGLRLRLDHRADVFDRDAAARILDRFQRVLEILADDPDQPVSRLDLLVADERELV
ncbi:condensation domain-containing protein, partial [Streptomyces apocyni]|uniref:condensation domain-containing protein n=1 Tax=Streptomyces apocyni TaxID=2654677 RepID=UPI001E4B403A